MLEKQIEEKIRKVVGRYNITDYFIKILAIEIAEMVDGKISHNLSVRGTFCDCRTDTDVFNRKGKVMCKICCKPLA